MKRIFSSISFLFFFLMVTPVSSSDLYNYLVPCGFQAPLLKQGQYSLNFRTHYYKTESEYEYFEGIFHRSECSNKTYSFSVDGIYAVTDQLILRSSLELRPEQTRSIYRRSNTTSSEDKLTSDFAVSPNFTVSFRPLNNMEFYGIFSYDKEKLHKKNEQGKHTEDDSGEYLSFDVGFTLLGNVK